MDWIKYNKERLEELPDDMRTRAIEFLKKTLNGSVRDNFRMRIAANPSNWWCENAWHFLGGMHVRNSLRDNICRDDALPSGNWDDYYVVLLEEAVKEAIEVEERGVPSQKYTDWDKW